MQVGFLGSANSWYFSDLVRAAKTDEQLVALSYEGLSARSGKLLRADAQGLPGSTEGTASIFSADALNLATLDAVLVRTMPLGSLEEVIFRMDVLGCYQQWGGLVMNPPRAVEAAIDKYLTTCRLDLAGLPVPRTMVCQTTEQAMVAFEQLGGDVVLKPLFGGEGRGLTRVSTPESAQCAFVAMRKLDRVLYLQEFIDHGGFDLRILLIGDQAFSMRRSNDRDWRTNVSRGARTEPVELSAELLELARQAANVIQAPLAGVDLLLAPSGQPYVLEVNAVPGWKALAKTLEVDISRHVWDYLATQLSP